jgi:hypothetical protein
MRHRQKHPTVRRLRVRCLYVLRSLNQWDRWILWLLLRPIFLPLDASALLLKKVLLRTSVLAEYKGIRLADFNGDTSDDEAFIACTLDALKLIEERDPRRFRRIQRELRYITNSVILSGGQYRRADRECKVNFTYYQKGAKGLLTLDGREHENYLWYLAFYAATLIHEATHGHLMSAGFPYAPQYRLRLERICHMEEKRFVARLSSEDYDFRSLIPPFDEARWRRSWNRSWWHNARLTFRLLMDNIRRDWQRQDDE